MSIRRSIICLTLVIVGCGTYRFATADPQLPILQVPPAPEGYLLVNEEMWSQLMDEGGRHLDRAREAFLHGHSRVAAMELRKAAIMMRIDAAHGHDRADVPVLKSARELEQLSHTLLNAQNTANIDDLDAVSSRALIALADHEQVKAALALKHNHVHRSGYYLRSAADNMERAAFRARVAISTSASITLKDARIASSRLVEGSGYAVDEVGLGIEALGRQIKHFSQQIFTVPVETR
jgi:hypothetical protein